MDDEISWDDLSNLPADPPTMRLICSDCRRPKAVCYCRYLPDERLNPACKIVILQHPAEEKRCLNTATILKLSLKPDKCSIYRGNRFPSAKYPELNEILSSPNAILLYPSTTAMDIQDLPKVEQHSEPYTIVIIDGTWAQAKTMFNKSAAIRSLKQVKLSHHHGSEYIIRTQPTDNCLSTVETAAEALSVLEDKASLKSDLLQPLSILCLHQLNHGAVIHESKEFRIKNNTYPKLVGKRLKKLLDKTYEDENMNDLLKNHRDVWTENKGE